MFNVVSINLCLLQAQNKYLNHLHCWAQIFLCMNPWALLYTEILLWKSCSCNCSTCCRQLLYAKSVVCLQPHVLSSPSQQSYRCCCSCLPHISPPVAIWVQLDSGGSNMVITAPLWPCCMAMVSSSQHLRSLFIFTSCSKSMPCETCVYWTAMSLSQTFQVCM